MTPRPPDISIREVDVERSYQPNPFKPQYYMYLKLSGYPPPGWAEQFAQERQAPRRPTAPPAWVEGDYIVVHCVPGTLETEHLHDLQADVRHANALYQEAWAREQQNL